MKELKKLWDRVEKQAIFVVLLLYLGLQILAEFVPTVDSFMTNRGSNVLMGVVLLFIFRYIAENLVAGQNVGLERIEIFTKGLIEFLTKNRSYETVDIFAHNGYMYFIAISESKAKIKNLRLLLRGSDNLDAMQFPSDDESKQTYRQQLEQMITNWLQLQKSGQVQSLSIRYYPYDPTGYFLIADRRRLHFGYLKPKHVYPGTEVMNSYVTDDSSKAGNLLVDDCQALFDTVWKEFGKSQDSRDA